MRVNLETNRRFHRSTCRRRPERGIERAGTDGGVKKTYRRCFRQQRQAIDQHVMLDADALKFLNVAASRLGWSARGTHRALKVARTIADLAGAQFTEVTHVAEAMQYRRRMASPI